MKDKSLRVLIIENSEDDLLLIIRELKKSGYKPVYERVETAGAMEKALKEKQWDIILCDYKMPKFNAPSAIAIFKKANIDIPIIVVTGTIGEETASECMRLGAQDYIIKGNLSRLCPAIARELEDVKVRKKQKQAEKDLQENEERFRRISSITSDIAYSCSTEEDGIFSIDWVIGATEQICGYSVEEIKAQSCWRFLVIEEDMALFEKNVIGLTPGSHGLCELRIRHKNGGIVWIASYAECSMTTGTPEHFILYGALLDITERKRSEESLRQSEEKYRTILEDIQEGYFEVDFAGNFTFFNDSLRRFLGYSKEELMGMNNRRYTDKEHSKKLFQAFNKVYNTEKPAEEFDWQIIRKDGTKRYVEASVSLQKDSSGKPTGFRGIVRDITERKKADEALRENESMLQESQRIAGLGTYVLDIPTGIFKTSKVMNDVLGIDETYDHSIKGWAALIHPDDRTMVFDYLFNEVIGRKQTADKEYRIVRFNNKAERWLHSLGKLEFDANGLPIKLHGTTQDITERKKAEEALKNSEEKYRNIFENAIEGIYQSTIEGKFITANTAFARMAGYDSPEELIASIKDIGTQLYVHPEDRKKLMEISEAKGFVDGFEVEFYKKDGGKFWVVINARAVKDEQGKIICLEGLIEDITIRKHAEEQLHQTLDRLKKAVGTTIQVLVSTVESRDPYTAGHQLRVADLARTIATEMGFPQEKIEGIRMAGSIHDIGKLSIPAEILVKPTKLTNIEFSLIKEHSQSGYEMLKDVESPWPLAEIVYQHHERMNGTGYPRNLKGDDILIEARIMAVADVVEAMASHRPYRPTLGIEAALEEIEKNKGILYDDIVADTCLRLFREKGYQLK
ncbi:MAG: PAS domain S-box protein [Smithella sp.]|jgi:PAS domain S-box-containing protein/putative nucleotidyltransferase with HDIG domain